MQFEEPRACPQCGGTATMVVHNATYYPDRAGKMAYHAGESDLSFRCGQCGAIFQIDGNGNPLVKPSPPERADFKST